jgi:hypothetical protein
MRITEGRIKQIVREELSSILRESSEKASWRWADRFLKELSNEEVINCLRVPDESHSVLETALVYLEEMHHTDAYRLASELDDYYRKNNSYSEEFERRQPEEEEVYDDEELY